MTSLILPLDLNRYADQEELELKQLQITLDMFRIFWKMNRLLIDCWSTGEDVRIWTFCLFIYSFTIISFMQCLLVRKPDTLFLCYGSGSALHMRKTTWSRICSNHYDQLYSKRNEPVNNNSNFADNSIGCISYIARSLYNPILWP